MVQITPIPNFDICAAFYALARQPYTLFFDSADRNHPQARYSILLFDPVETLTCKNGDRDPFSDLQKLLDQYPPLDSDLPFSGGVAGLFSYDLGRYLEKLPRLSEDNPNLPDLAVGLYKKGFVTNHKTGESYFFSQNNEPPPAFETKTVPAPAKLNWQTTREAQAYKADIQNVIDYIHAGDIFQANLAQRFEATLPPDFDAAAHYLHLRAVNPAPFAGFMNLGEVQIASASPERFLQCDPQGQISTCPIKGTRPRSDNPAEDEQIKNILRTSEKDRAENTMIVDLLRNDLSKSCTPESVEVEQLCALESFASVHHLVSTVRGQLREDLNALDALRACFPGGSITGAPKIRAMEIIEELEPTRRGPYCGSLGYIGFDGAMDSNILIRTITFADGKAQLHAGGGIVADSNVEDEYQETLDKARAMMA